MISIFKQRGFSIIELMVALVLGLLVVGVIVNIFLSTNRNFALDEQTGIMQENARYAMRKLLYDVRMAGFWGETQTINSVNAKMRDCTSEAESFAEDPTYVVSSACQGSLGSGSKLYYGNELFASVGDCASTSDPPDTDADINSWVFDTNTPLKSEIDVSSTYVESEYPCIDTDSLVENTNLLTVKRTEGTGNEGVHNEDENKVIIRTQGDTNYMMIYFEDDDPADLNSGTLVTKDWVYKAYIYYIRNYSISAGDGITTLARISLDENRMMTEESEGIAEGVENFNVVYGIDDDNDGVANIYKSSPTDTELENVVSAKLYLLVRTPEPDFQYADDKSYNLGDLSIAAKNDNYHRKVFTATTLVRNAMNSASLNRFKTL